jgi:hypothetical protein
MTATTDTLSRMSAVWHDDGAGWRLLSPIGFPSEATLHELVEQTPAMLPLAGAPQLAVVGREVSLASGYADLIAIEPSGRPVVIEIKLAHNSEARRAVVSQILTYAAVLHGLTPEQFETDVLGRHLQKLGLSSLADAARGVDQEGAFDVEAFRAALAEHLQVGSFRLVLVLDSAPPELVRLVGYLEAIGDKLLIDLVTVSSFDASGSRILVPQRVEPERRPIEPPRGVGGGPKVSTATATDGPGEFQESIEEAPVEHQDALRRLCAWAVALEGERLVKLQSYRGMGGEVTLLPRLQPENAGLVTVWNSDGASMSIYRSVFERRAPESIPKVEALIAPKRIAQGNTITDISDELLAALTDAYREANRARA